MGGAAADRGAEPAREQLLYEVGLRAGRCISLPPTAMSTAPRKPPTATTVAASGTVRANASLDEGSGRSRGEGSRAARCVALVFRVRDRTRSQAYTCGYKEDTKRRIQRAGGGGGCLHPRELRAVPNRGGRRFVARARRGSERVHPRVEACSPRALHKIRLTKSAAGTGAPQGEGACPLSTRGGTRLVRLVRGKGGGQGSGGDGTGATAVSRLHVFVRARKPRRVRAQSSGGGGRRRHAAVDERAAEREARRRGALRPLEPLHLRAARPLRPLPTVAPTRVPTVHSPPPPFRPLEGRRRQGARGVRRRGEEAARAAARRKDRLAERLVRLLHGRHRPARAAAYGVRDAACPISTG